jgi:4-hydroxy-tetrahydrodipicolinate synthase
MNDGFVTALGTPLSEDGSLVSASFDKHIRDQIDCGASALLVMGTMGNEAYIRDSVYPIVAKAAVETAGGRLPVLVGVMDCSVSRVRDRIDSLSGLGIDGVVATAPFYLKSTQEELLSFFSHVADNSPFPLYLYDLPPVTQVAIDPGTVKKLMRHGNIRGIKSGVLSTCRLARFSDEKPDNFTVMYSGLDTFDAAWAYGIRKNLDGMFSCTPRLSERMYRALKAGEMDDGRRDLDRIIGLRDAFVEIGVLKGFTAAMNLLGYEGSFSPDYMEPPTSAEREFIRSAMASFDVE